MRIKRFGYQCIWLGENGAVVYWISQQPGNIKKNNDQNKLKERILFFEHCLQGRSREDLLEAYISECIGIGGIAVKVEMPEKVLIYFIQKLS